MSWWQTLGKVISKPYRLVRDGQADLDAVYPDHEPKSSLEQAAVQGLGRRRRRNRSRSDLP